MTDKVAIRRAVPEAIHMRVVWRGGGTNTLDVPVLVGSFSALSGRKEMEACVLDLARVGHSDEVIAVELTTVGYQSARDLWRFFLVFNVHKRKEQSSAEGMAFDFTC